MEAALVGNAILFDYVTSKVALVKPEIRSTDPSIPIDINCTDEAPDYSMPGVWEEYNDECEEIEASNAIPMRSSNNRHQPNSRGLTWEPVMSTGTRATIATMLLPMWRKKHHKLMID
ncbi:hypothetical protein BDD12DRAFT_802787 [Trichophaea hybrida]|nr:hypothetical protein BDD12DRAFT_802787 [Trichophaea hybrida]